MPQMTPAGFTIVSTNISLLPHWLEALWRSANIQWHQEKADVSKRPSSQEMDPYLRVAMNEEPLKLVIKKFPHTKWADMAAFNLIDNKVCGSWKGETKCP